MTREEAIKIIYCYDIGFYDLSGEKIPADKLADAFDMAIEALQREDNLLKSLETNEPLYDMVDVVRCKDCKHWASAEDYDCKIHSGAFGAEDFCSYGERKGGEDK